MPEITKEVPEGLRNTEMTLVRMLKEHRSWADIRDIAGALWRVQFTAKRMKDEHIRNFGGSNEGAAEVEQSPEEV